MSAEREPVSDPGAGHRLYTPAVLAAALDLARFPFDPAAPLTGEARSASCGSRLTLGFARDGGGGIARLGLACHACAIGQASAAVFARHAEGRGPDEIGEFADRIRHWLTEGGSMPGWPDLALIAPARDYPARHGAIMLPWIAAGRALAGASRTSPESGPTASR